MRADTDTIDEFVASDYKYGFVTDIESQTSVLVNPRIFVTDQKVRSCGR